MNFDDDLKKWRITYDQKARLTSSRKAHKESQKSITSPVKIGDDGDNIYNK